MSKFDVQRVLAKSVISLASKYYVKKIISEVVDMLENTDPNMIWKYVVTNTSINEMTEEQKEELRRRLKLGYRLAYSKGLQDVVRSKIEEVSAKDFMVLVIGEALRRYEEGRKKAYENLLFIASNKPATRWFVKLYDDLKKYILDEWDRIARGET